MCIRYANILNKKVHITTCPLHTCRPLCYISLKFIDISISKDTN